MLPVCRWRYNTGRRVGRQSWHRRKRVAVQIPLRGGGICRVDIGGALRRWESPNYSLLLYVCLGFGFLGASVGVHESHLIQ